MQGISRTEALILVAMTLAVLMDGIDSSIVNVALPTIAAGFGTDVGVAAWITIIYFMMIAGMMLMFGRIADSGYIKKVFLLGFVIFTVASLMCGLSTSFTMLCVSRAVQGMGAAMLGAVAPMMCVKFIPAENLGFSLGVLTLASAVGLSLGPALGGIITDHLSWNWIFFINIPIGLFAVLYGHFVIPKDVPEKGRHLDLPGSAALFACIVSGVLALENVSVPGMTALVLVSTAVCVLCLAAFILIERRSPQPLLKLSVFRIRDLDLLIVSYLTINIVYYGLAYMLPFYLNVELNLDATTSGLILLIPAIITLLMCIPVGKACDIHGRRPFAVAANIIQVIYCVSLFILRPDMGIWPLIPISILIGVVEGLCGASSSSRIVDAVPEGEKGMGSTLMNFIMYMSGTVGTAMLASLFNFGASSEGTPIDQLPPEVFMDGFTFAMLFTIVVAVVSLVTAWAVNETKKPRTSE